MRDKNYDGVWVIHVADRDEMNDHTVLPQNIKTPTPKLYLIHVVSTNSVKFKFRTLYFGLTLTNY